MLIFFHLFTGIVIGLLIGDLFHDRRWVIPFTIGAVLPDLIDKPIGYIFFADVFGNGRIFMHSLLVFGILLIIGLVSWKHRAHPAILAVALGVLSHQILDLMWEDPTTWYYPLFGPFHYSRGSDYAFVLLQSEIGAGSEWILAAGIIIAVILYLSSKQYIDLISPYRKAWAVMLGAGALVCCALAGMAIGTGLLPLKIIRASPFRFFNWNEPAYCILGGIVFAFCACLLWRLKTGLIKKTEMSNTEISSVK